MSNVCTSLSIINTYLSILESITGTRPNESQLFCLLTNQKLLALQASLQNDNGAFVLLSWLLWDTPVDELHDLCECMGSIKMVRVCYLVRGRSITNNIQEDSIANITQPE